MTCLKSSAGERQRWEERHAQKTLGPLSNALHIDHALKQHHHSSGPASTTYRQVLSYSGNEYATFSVQLRAILTELKSIQNLQWNKTNSVKHYKTKSFQHEIKSATNFPQNFQWKDSSYVRECCTALTYQAASHVTGRKKVIASQYGKILSLLSPVLFLSLSRSWYGKHHLAWLPTPCSANWTRQLPNLNSCRNGSW